MAPPSRSSVLTVVPDLDPSTGFTGAQLSQIEHAIQTWNQFGQEARGRDFFKLGQGRVPLSIRSANPRNCGSDIGDTDIFYIVRDKDSNHWNNVLGFSDQVPAATIRCYSGADFVRQVVMIKTELIADPSQLTSVALHELGHALGLDHSCINSAGRADYRSCFGLTTSHPYHQAVMFPTLAPKVDGGSAPEIKESLSTNDIERARCFYGSGS